MDTEPCLCTATPSPQWQNRGGGDCTQAKLILIFLQGKYNFNWHNQGLLNKLAKLDLNTRFGAEDIASAG